MTKRDMIEALDGLDDDTPIRAEIELCAFGTYSTEECDLTVKNVYQDCVILHGEL